MNFIRILNGTYGKKPVTDVVFPMVKQFTVGAKGGYVTVDGSSVPGYPDRQLRILCDNPSDYEFVNDTDASVAKAAVKNETVSTETDEEIMERIGKRFDILNKMTLAAKEGNVRAMIVTGPPGVGKSYGVESTLDKDNLFNAIASRKPKYEVVKGAMTPIGLYVKLFEFSDERNVLVFDDCDTVLFDDLSLNILKAALDSGNRRRIHWNADSALLRKEGVPNSFDFKGSIIFITNLKFDHVKSKKLQDHLEALQSRCHYLDLTMDSMRERILRIKQIANSTEFFARQNLDEAEVQELLEFMFDNSTKLREVSLRMALKLADLFAMDKGSWKDVARITCMKSA